MNSRRRLTLSLNLILTVFLIVLTACGGPAPTTVAPTQQQVTSVEATTATQPALAATATLEPTPVPPDSDGDGYLDSADNCASQLNPAQSDLDTDNRGDVCDVDLDGDGAPNAGDACPFTAAEECVGGVPVVVELFNPAAIALTGVTGTIGGGSKIAAPRAAAAAAVPVSSVELIYFPSGDQAVPDLLNGVVNGMGDEPLWSEAAGLNLMVTALPLNGPVTWAAGGARRAIQGGEINLSCPGAWGGTCLGTLSFADTPEGCADEACAAPPECAAGDARCDWGASAAGLAAPLVWGAYNAETNAITFATGMPAQVFGNLAARHDVAIESSAYERTFFHGGSIGMRLPLVVEDKLGDCSPNQECPVGMDVVRASIALAGDGAEPGLSITLVTDGNILESNTRIGILLVTRNEAGDLAHAGYSIFMDGGRLNQIVSHKPWGGAWTGRTQPAEDIQAAVDGNTATLSFPLVLNSERIVWIQTAGTFKVDALPVREDYLRDFPAPNVSPVPLIYVAWPTTGQAGAPALAEPLFERLTDALHGFKFAPPMSVTIPIGVPEVAEVDGAGCARPPSEANYLIVGNLVTGTIKIRPADEDQRDLAVALNGVCYVVLDPRVEGQAADVPAPAVAPPAPQPIVPVNFELPFAEGDLAVGVNSVSVYDVRPTMIDGKKVWAHNVQVRVTVTNTGMLPTSQSIIMAELPQTVFGRGAASLAEYQSIEFWQFPGGELAETVFLDLATRQYWSRL